MLQARDRYRHGGIDLNAILEARGLYQLALEMDPAYAEPAQALR